MMLRTHLAIIVLIIILFLPSISGKIAFTLAALIATLIPDIDTGYSTLGKMKGFRLLQFFARHRGIFHSLTFGIAASIALAFFWPSISLGFFLGYSVHLFFDSFTRDGIMPFWPYKKTSYGIMKTGTLTETTIFIVLVIFDFILLIVMIGKIF